MTDASEPKPSGAAYDALLVQAEALASAIRQIKQRLYDEQASAHGICKQALRDFSEFKQREKLK